MPVGPYETFTKCVAAQKKKGHDDESARKICGEMEKRTKSEKSVDKARAWIYNVLKR